jgi:hypothetical protein
MAKVKPVKSKTKGIKTKNTKPAEDFTKGPDPESAPAIENSVEHSVASNGSTTGNIIDNLLKSPHYRTRPVSTVEGLGTLSTEKRATKLRDKIGVAADHLADELMFAVSTRSKKDKEYIKGLVWSLGVLFDKLNTGSADTLSVHLPSKLLENVKLAISVQIERKTQEPIIIAQPDYVVSSNDDASSATALPSTP